MGHKTLKIIFVCAILIFPFTYGSLIPYTNANPAKTGSSHHKKHTFMIAPLIGLNHSELKSSRSPNTTDTQIEYGLFSLYRSDYMVLSNMSFLTGANNSDISGNFFFANFYGDPQSTYTWNLGAGHLWHGISSSANDITINIPMIKSGFVRRFKKINASLNPYIAYAWESVDTTRGDSNSESILYGVSASWRWKTLHLNAKYYLEDKRESDNYYNVARFRALYSLTENLGIALRFEYMEHSTIDNTSFLIGPAFIF